MSDTARPNRKVIFADFAVVKFDGVIRSLQRAEVGCEAVSDLPTLQTRLAQEHFEICVINLLLAKNGPFEMLQSVKTLSRNKEIKVIVVTKQMQKVNVQNALNAGANDFIGDPFETLNLYHRILYHLSPVKVIEAKGLETSTPSLESNDYVRILLESVELLGRTGRDALQGAFYKVLKQISEKVHSNRTSLIVVDDANNTGVVLASSDDPNFFNFPISLDKYPEVTHVMHTGNLIFVEDVTQNALTDAIKNNVKTIAIGSIMVFPVSHQGDLVGVLVIRRQKVTDVPPAEVMRVLQATANILAAHANIAVRLRKIYQGFNKKTDAA
jgi:CheY-like chemotaxis protein